MSISRRNLLQCAGGGCALALLPCAVAASPDLRHYRVQDGVALPRFAPGDLVLADTAVTQFAGDGLYLYPAWGQPRLYEVQLAAGRLAYRNPGSGQVLWTQSAGMHASFAGRMLDAADTAALVALPALQVPRLPTTA